MFSTPIQKTGSAPSAVQTAREAFFQPKLTINAPGDQYEQEADAMAERVVQAPQSQGPVSGADAVGSVQRQAEDREEEPVQRKCSDCEKEEKERVQRQEKEPEEEPVQRQPEKEEEEKPPVQMMPLMRKSAGGGCTATPALSSRLSASKGGGSVLPAPTRAHMESTFGADFSRVQIHTDRDAAEMNAGISARAFTHGSDIYFNSGQYAPESGEGRRLLAHELTHVVQQAGHELNMSSTINKFKKPILNRNRAHGYNLIQRKVEKSDDLKVRYGGFSINMDNIKAGKNAKKFTGIGGIIKFLPNENSPDTDRIVFIQVARNIKNKNNYSHESPQTGSNKPLNEMATQQSFKIYKTQEKDTLNSISKINSKWQVSPEDIYEKNIELLQHITPIEEYRNSKGALNKDKIIGKNIGLEIPEIQKGYFIDHLPSNLKPREKKKMKMLRHTIMTQKETRKKEKMECW